MDGYNDISDRNSNLWILTFHIDLPGECLGDDLELGSRRVGHGSQSMRIGQKHRAIGVKEGLVGEVADII